MAGRLAPLLLFALAAAAEMEDDLHCSACNLFVETYMQKCQKAVFTKPKATDVFGVYKHRLLDILKKHAPKKKHKATDLLMRAGKGREHELYDRVCKKYKLDPEPEYFEPDPDESESSRKARQAKEALKQTVEGVKAKGNQWATMGEKGSRKIVGAHAPVGRVRPSPRRAPPHALAPRRAAPPPAPCVAQISTSR